MADLLFSAERRIDAPAAVVYTCLADYAHHHRPGGFLPPAFINLQVLEGGVGAGTRIRFQTRLAGAVRTMVADVAETEPGHVLVETGSGVTTTFTVEADGDGCRVRIASLFETRGVAGFFTRQFAPRLLSPVYADELRRLEEYARGLAAQSGALATTPSP